MSIEGHKPVQDLSQQHSVDQTDRQQSHPSSPSAPTKLSLVVYSGTFSRVHYALVLASAAAAVGTPATLFFTMEATRFLGKPHADGTPGWRVLPAGPPAGPAEPAGLATGGGAASMPSAGGVDDAYAERGVATFEELLLACTAFGVTFMVCEMGLKAIGLKATALREDLNIVEGGVVSFLADASEKGAMLFI